MGTIPILTRRRVNIRYIEVCYIFLNGMAVVYVASMIQGGAPEMSSQLSGGGEAQTRASRLVVATLPEGLLTVRQLDHRTPHVSHVELCKGLRPMRP